MTASPWLGTELGTSDWLTVTQDDVTTFAKLIGDEQWIHVDTERAKDAGVATESAKRLHVAVRTLTYRLDRIRVLSGYNRPTRPIGSPCRPRCLAPGP